jgi:iron-sulfur cluster repair protein YtfE (RIC family)
LQAGDRDEEEMPMNVIRSRRDLLKTTFSAAAVLSVPAALAAAAAATEKKGPAENEPEVTATEDLMREHGILRRVLLVYRETAPRLRQRPSDLEAGSLRDAALLFRAFGEEYHEKLLEEKQIFPVVRKRGGEAARYTDVLVEQHRRGREITDYILTSTKSGKISPSVGAELAEVLEALDRMYEHHAAREDTIVFPAWKLAFTNKQLDEKADEFEDIEKKMFGHDGFEDAEKKISKIEQALGLADLAVFTAAPPPSAARRP